MLYLPELPLCPIHQGKPVEDGFASCKVCWDRFYFSFEYQPVIDRLNRKLTEFNALYHKTLESHSGRQEV
jgi:hypothetical protein